MSEVLTDSNYYSVEMNFAYCSASQYLSFVGRPILAGCEARTMAELKGEWKQETTKAMLIGSILDSLWEGCTSEQLLERFPDCVSSRGATKGQLKAEYQQAIVMYERTARDRQFAQFMSGVHQPIFTCEIEGLPFKCKLDSYHADAQIIVDLKTTEDTDIDHRVWVKDSGERLPFFEAWGYPTQLAIYREAVRQETGDTCKCYICAIDKKPHPKPLILRLEDNILDNALEEVKRHCAHIIKLKSGEIDPIKCEQGSCDYCRDTYETVIINTEQFKEHDIPRDAI